MNREVCRYFFSRSLFYFMEARVHYRFIFTYIRKILSPILKAGVIRSPTLCMRSIEMITFCKNAKCPSSVKLLAFQGKELTADESRAIERHVNLCEFCEAEIEFYSNYPQSDEKVIKAEIPNALFELAQSLLGDQNHDLLEILCAEDKVPT